MSTHSGTHKIGNTSYSNTTIKITAKQEDYEATPIYGFGWNWIADWGMLGGFSIYWHTKKEFDLEINYVGSTISDTDKALHEKEIESYIVDPKKVIIIYNISSLHKNMYVLKYSILNSFSQNPAISAFFRKVHFDEREFAG